ncbi:MAG: hypothetical protein HQM16_12955 [Deltaproteobacteria bacterium]|nr:hypothetical protein [Deltaproteobacteria bacterium]
MKKKTKTKIKKNSPNIKSSPLKFTLFNTILPELKQQSSYFSIDAIKNNSLPIKTNLFDTILPQLKQQGSYFSIKSVQRALNKNSIRIADQTVRKYMSQATLMSRKAVLKKTVSFLFFTIELRLKHFIFFRHIPITQVLRQEPIGIPP